MFGADDRDAGIVRQQRLQPGRLLGDCVQAASPQSTRQTSAVSGQDKFGAPALRVPHFTGQLLGKRTQGLVGNVRGNPRCHAARRSEFHHFASPIVSKKLRICRGEHGSWTALPAKGMRQISRRATGASCATESMATSAPDRHHAAPRTSAGRRQFILPATTSGLSDRRIVWAHPTHNGRSFNQFLGSEAAVGLGCGTRSTRNR